MDAVPPVVAGVALAVVEAVPEVNGWAVHGHVKVHLGGNVVHTGQLFFPDALSDRVYRAAPYKARGNPDTPDAADAIYRNGGSRSLLHPVRSGRGYTGAMVMGVHPG